jgi:hypothetical protein
MDITPGSKGQACSLARIPGVELWTMRGDEGTAAPLLRPGGTIELAGPPLEIAAALRGGILEHGGDDAAQVPKERRQFLILLTEFLSCFLRSNRTGAMLGELGNYRECAHGRMKRLRGDRVRVFHRGQRAEGSLPGGGFWFEHLVGNAFIKVRADEVRLNMRWAWPEDYVQSLREGGFIAADERPHRREVDVAARFGHQIIAASCKTGGTMHSFDAWRREAEALAIAGFGRLAVPILIHPCPPADLVRASGREKGRALVLGLAELGRDGLRKDLLSLFRSRSTLLD